MARITRITTAGEVSFCDHLDPDRPVHVIWEARIPGCWTVIDPDTGEVLSEVIGQRPRAKAGRQPDA